MATAQLSDGATVWFERTGSGAPLLQIHGSAFGHRNFAQLSPLLAPHLEVIDLDLPGFGQSHGGPTGQDFAGYAAQVAELIGVMGYERVHVHGTSFGAMIALTLAVEHPEVVDRLVLSCFVARYDSAARIMRATWKRAARDSAMDAVADLTAVAGFARSYYDKPGADEQLDAMRAAFLDTDPAAFVAATEAIERADLSPLVSRLPSTTLLLAGSEDNMTPFRPADSGVGMAQIADLIPGAESHVLEQCGHYLVIEQAAAAAALITGFLERSTTLSALVARVTEAR